MAKTIKHQWKLGASSSEQAATVLVLDTGRVLIVADASTDADGAPDAENIDPDGSKKTSLGKANGWKGDGEYVNARAVPYFVLPKNWKEVTGVTCKLGDIAKISYKGNSIFAIYADAGPTTSIGEASISAVEALNFNPWNKSKTKIIKGIPYGVTYEIIAGSKNLLLSRTFEEIQHYGKILFNEEAAAETIKQDGIEWIGVNESKNKMLIFSAHTAEGAIYSLQINETTKLVNFLSNFPDIPIKLYDTPPPKFETKFLTNIVSDLRIPSGNADKFIMFFNMNYAAVREEVEGWFVPKYSPEATQNGCVAHQVSCLKLCGLPYPDWNSKTTMLQAINVDYYVVWAQASGWTKITDISSLLPGDICVSGPKSDLSSLDHVYAFYQYIDSSTALVLHNQAFGLSKRSLIGRGGVGTWRFALRMP